MSTPFRTTRRVEFADTDMAGMVHFANFFRYMEAAEVDFLRSRGLSVAFDWEGQHLGLPRVAASCDYFRPARFEDLLDVTVTIARLGRTSITYEVEFFRQDELLARGRLTAVCCRIEPGHPPVAVELPAAFRARLQPD